MKTRKVLSLILASMMLLSASGCGGSKGEVDGKTNIRIGGWPDETRAEELKLRNEKKDVFMAQNPDINIIPDTYGYDVSTFTMKASAGQLPDIYTTFFTETGKIIDSGYAADITDVMKKYGLDKAMNPNILELVTKDGKIYGIPGSSYAQGLYINKALFKEAGLVDENGQPRIPETYEEMAEYAKIIKEKTGRAGYVIPTTGNCGGWHFLNIAWAHGVDFMEQDENGKWIATFDTPECVEALQYVKDLKWKYNALPDNTVIDLNEVRKNFATGQAAMVFADPPSSYFCTQYGMNKDDIFVASMPEGKAGRFSQMGGDVWMFSSTVTEEEIEACLKWLIFNGVSPELSEEAKENKKKEYAVTISEGGIVLDRNPFSVWVSPERIALDEEIASEYTNVNFADYENYYAFEGVEVKPEEPMCCQELYAVLDKCIQEVVTNENADCAALIKEACNDFQVNHLDKTK